MSSPTSPDQAQSGEPRSDEALRRPKVHDIHAAVLADGEEELHRSGSALFWSGLAAGMSMAFSLIASGLLKHSLHGVPGALAVSHLGYCVGFVIVVIGRQQLFTENTLTVVLPLLHHRTASALFHLLRVWAIVLVANLAGGLAVAWVLANSHAFDPAVKRAFLTIGQTALEPDAATVLLRGIYAGWLIALLVWLLPAAGPARLWIIVLLTYIVGLGHLSHVVAGAIEVFYVAAAGEAEWGRVVLRYVLPALCGNVIGGVLLTTVVNHAQVVAGNKN
jgi:formate-nitrite transporter family protein